MHNESLAAHALSGKDKPKGKAKKELHKMHITKMKSGGYHVMHEHVAHPPEEHAVPDTDALHEHIEEHMGEPNTGEASAAPTGPEAGE